MNSILKEIASYKRQWVRRCKVNTSENELLQRAQAYQPRGFSAALQNRIEAKENAVIAEVKKASPSKGIIRADFDPVGIAESYANGGACCLSVLTDEKYFQGSDKFLQDIRRTVELPILRKDFMLDSYQVVEARALGADAILIILAMLDDVQAADIAAAARAMHLSILPEVHNASELERALRLETQLIGINNRNLHDFSTTLGTTIELLEAIGSDKTVITESGIHTLQDIQRMNRAGVHGFLIGESLMRQANPGDALINLLGNH